MSGGQAQRVFIARALINNPSILVLDEPTEGIDSKHVKDFYNVLFKLKEKDVTILLVTHDIGVVVDNADRVACLNEHLHFHGTNTEFQISVKLNCQKSTVFLCSSYRISPEGVL